MEAVTHCEVQECRATDIRLAFVESCLAWTFSQMHLPVTEPVRVRDSRDDHAEFHSNHGGSGGQGSSKTNDH
jgi:hypothetical protein